MSDPPLSLARPGGLGSSKPRTIPSLTSSSSPSSSSFSGTPKSSIARKKPKGLDISESIKATRAAPAAPGEGSTKDGLDDCMSEAEKLRKDIERLQLSSAGSSVSSVVDSPPTSPGTIPTTPQQSDSSSGSHAKKVKSSGKKKAKVDKDGLELVKDEDLETLADLGAGNGGTVTKVWNKKRNCVMARKLILVDAKPAIRKQIVRELQILNDCNSPYIVSYYGCFPVDVHVGMVMEYMDPGSLDHIYRRHGALHIDIVGKVAEAVLRGLVYLYDVHRIIHRDIKPSNILVNTSGQIKICDFGVSGELINSIANTFVGTSTYMSPERIQGAPYTIKSDLWSLGISLIELATARFPFSDSNDTEDSDSEGEFDPDPTLPLSTQRPRLDSNGNKKKKRTGVSQAGGHGMSILDLLQHIVGEPAPRLASRRRSFPPEAVEFVDWCLDKDPTTRKGPQELLVSKWIVSNNITSDAIKAWALSVRDTSDN